MSNLISYLELSYIFFVDNVIFERFLLLAFCYFHLFKTVHLSYLAV